VPFDPDASPAMEDPLASATPLFDDPELGPKNEDGHAPPSAATNSTDTVSVVHFFLLYDEVD
jgi:hypothetical protein